ncbi:MAG: heme exporter protein CcmB, partial [Candidatus Methylomirabilales bacterium]
ALAAKDLLSEARAKEIAPPMVLLGLTLIFLFTFAVPPGSGRAPVPEPIAGAVGVREISAALLWASLLFAGILGFGRSAAAEREGSHTEALLLAPVDPAALFAGKALANFVYLSVVEAALLPASVLFFDLASGAVAPVLLLVALPANIGLAAAGTLFGAISQYARARELVLGLLTFPVVLPIVLAATQLTGSLLTRGTFSGEGRWFILMGAFDLAIPAIGAVTYEYVLRE